MNSSIKERAKNVLRAGSIQELESFVRELADFQSSYTASPAPSVPDGWRPFLTDVVTAAGLLEHGKRDNGLAGRIGKFAFDAMRAAPTPAEPPADVARDAERYRWLTADHASAETRLDVNNIASSIQVRSYAATSAAIDAAIERGK